MLQSQIKMHGFEFPPRFDNLMKGYKSSETRLVYLFKDGREKWKERALSKQKKLRAMEIKVRDISLSREKWKEKAIATRS